MRYEIDWDQLDKQIEYEIECHPEEMGIEGIEGEDWLGGCSYQSEIDFCHPEGYWPDMKAQAKQDLIDKIESLIGAIPVKV